MRSIFRSASERSELRCWELRAFQGTETTIRDHALKGDIELAESTLTFTARGIIKNSDTIQKVLEMLNTIAGQVEAAPIL